MTELETRIANVVAQGLREGLIHPGDPAQNQGPFAIPLAAFSRSSMPPEQAEHMQATAQLIAEAIVALINTQATIVDSNELRDLRGGDHPPAPTDATMVYCRQCHAPLVRIPTNAGVATVDARAFASVISQHTCQAGAA